MASWYGWTAGCAASQASRHSGSLQPRMHVIQSVHDGLVAQFACRTSALPSMHIVHTSPGPTAPDPPSPPAPASPETPPVGSPAWPAVPPAPLVVPPPPVVPVPPLPPVPEEPPDGAPASPA